MSAKFVSVVALVGAGCLLLSLASCGRDQQLVSIAIQPAVETLGATTTPVSANQGAQVQLRALGTYIHPPVTKDITNQATWASNTPQMFTVDSAGLLTATGDACGGTLISATVNTNTSSGGISSSGAIVTGYMTANVICFTGTGGGSGNPLLSLTFLGNGTGTVVSSPLGFSCANPGPCSTQAFVAGTPITLTATANPGSTFGSWNSTCPNPTTTNVCSFTVSANAVLTVIFN
jgi:Divergent InlB B-repeat domain